ncbi:MAG TPA: hypothetical protein VIC55_09915, partial [Gemmatimonadaceae bacterium]
MRTPAASAAKLDQTKGEVKHGEQLEYALPGRYRSAIQLTVAPLSSRSPMPARLLVLVVGVLAVLAASACGNPFA